jgi:uncharacterized 2Fe-2S/4Fe-4S cluster protein (DUF4445 family)
VASRLDEAKEPLLLMDIGTTVKWRWPKRKNPRLFHRGGPAFEGAGIYCGTQAVPAPSPGWSSGGRLFRPHDRGRCTVRALRFRPDRRAAAMLSAGILDETGRIDENSGILRRAHGGGKSSRRRAQR